MQTYALGSEPKTLESDKKQELLQKLGSLKKERSAVMLAHNYQEPDVQDAADYVGDSLYLARQAAKTESEVILFCGVHFMAETASILSPEKTVLLPDLRAGCSLADSISASELRKWKEDHPGAKVVMYVNTSAEVKAETDYCCTSSNAAQVVSFIKEKYGKSQEILFGPDLWLGAYVERELGLEGKERERFHIWPGECHVHAAIRPSDIEKMRKANPDADFLIHPECGCTSQVLEYLASGEIENENVHIVSTSGMIEHVKNKPEGSYIVATETGMLHPILKACPSANLIPANPCAICPFMKMITLEKSVRALEEMSPEVQVPVDIAKKARLPIERMVSIG